MKTYQLTASEVVEQYRRNTTAALSFMPENEGKEFVVKAAKAQLDIAESLAGMFDTYVATMKKQFETMIPATK